MTVGFTRPKHTEQLHLKVDSAVPRSTIEKMPTRFGSLAAAGYTESRGI